MEDVELITKEELDSFLKQDEHIRALIELKTVELAKILYDREPIGEIFELDIEESEFEPGCIHVCFETYFCSETDYESYELPFEFLYNEKYPIHYKYLHGEKQRELNEQKEEKRREDYERTKLENECYDRSEYSRLRKKYGND